MKKNFCGIFLSILFSISALNIQAQPADSSSNCHVRISVLTVEPGQELYSIFGHSAIRVQDSLQNMDIVYGWGTFNFDEPNFYLKFLKGNLNYYVSVDRFNDFIQEYKDNAVCGNRN